MIKLYQTTNDGIFWDKNQYCFAIRFQGNQTRVCNCIVLKDDPLDYLDREMFNLIYYGVITCEQ
jgi:hypothetical protein